MQKSLLEYLEIKIKSSTRELHNKDGLEFSQDKHNDTFKDVSTVKFNRLPKSFREGCCYDSF